MAGGIGSRFWPLSRRAKPKQFLDVLGIGRTLLQMTYDRFASKYEPEDIFIITNELYVDLVREQLPELGDWQIIGEPLRKNTAPCIAYCAFKFASHDPDGLMIVSPADHLITDIEEFHDVVDRAREFASNQDSLVTLGIEPTRPDTGYGYIQHLESAEEVKKVKTFTEKPNLELAKTFVASGDFLWNSGIFIWSFSSLMSAVQQHIPAIYDIFKDGDGKYHSPDEKSFLKQAYALCPNLSVDHGILERADNVYVIPSRFNWSDLGTWESLYVNSEKDDNGNVVLGCKAVLRNVKNCLILSDNPEKVIVLQDLENMFAVDSGDSLLISDRNAEQEVKKSLAEFPNRRLDNYL